MRVRNLITSNESGPHRSKCVKSLTHHPLLAILLELPVASRHVVADRVSSDIVNRGRLADLAAAFDDHDHQLGFIVHFGADTRNDDWLAITDECRREFAE